MVELCGVEPWTMVDCREIPPSLQPNKERPLASGVPSERVLDRRARYPLAEISFNLSVDVLHPHRLDRVVQRTHNGLWDQAASEPAIRASRGSWLRIAGSNLGQLLRQTD
jgi:hypothetical protein